MKIIWSGCVGLLLLFLLSGVVSAQATDAKANLKVYKVNHVAPDDQLNLRAAAGVEAATVGAIPHNGMGIVATGQEKKVGSSTWVQVHWSGKTGWVNRYYLLEDVQTSSYDPGKTRRAKTSVVMKCSGNEPSWAIDVTETNIKVRMIDGPQYDVPVEFRQQSANNTSIAVIAGRRGNALTSLYLQKVEICSDGMSDKNYPYSITAMLNSHKVVSGCCTISGN